MIPGGESASTDSRLTRSDRLKVALALWVVLPVLRLLRATYRFRLVEGEERVAELLGAQRSVVVAGWHESLLVCGSFVVERLVSKGFPFALLVSLSRDGELMARFVERLGIATVRGSTSRGGLSGLRRLYRTLSRTGRSVGIAPDGPRGPARVCQPGALLLAQLAGTPVVPVAGAAERAWRAGSWDRMAIPKPFSRIAIAVGEPFHVSPSLGSSELASECQRFAGVLNELADRAASGLRGRP